MKITLHTDNIELSGKILKNVFTIIFLAGLLASGYKGFTQASLNYATSIDINTASFSGTSFSVAAQDIGPTDLAFNNDGTKMYVVGSGTDAVIEYALSTAFDVSSAAFTTGFSVAAQETTPRGLAFNNDGTKMYVVGVFNRNVNEYALSAAFDVSSAAFTTNFSVAGEDTLPIGLAFNNDGTKMYVLGAINDNVNEYVLSTAFDVSSAAFTTGFSVAAQETSPQGLAFNNDGTKMYVVGVTNDNVYEYNLSSNAFTEASANDGSVEGSLIVSISGDTFTNAGGTLNSPTHFTISNLPAGLTPSMSVSSNGMTATLTLSGNASGNDDANDITDLQFTFTNAAFNGGNATGVNNAVNASSNLGIDFTAGSTLAPQAPGLFSYTTSDTSIELSWDDVENETGYILERSTDDITYLQFTTLAADATGFTDSGLSPNTLYYYRIRSQNAQGESANSTARNATFSTSPSTRFENFQTFGGDGFDYGRAVAVDASGNYYFWGVFSTSINIGGTILSNSNGRQAMFLAKYDANDNFLWARSYLPSINGFAHEVSISNTGDIYLTGQFEGTFMSLAATPVDINGVNYSNGFLLKIDVNGNEIWTRTFSQSGNGNMYGLDTDSNGDVYVSGTYRASGLFAGFSLPSQGGAAIFKYDESGNEIWADYSVQTDESSLTTFLGLNVSINNEIYVSGRIFSTTTFGNTKGPSKAITASNGVEDALLIKYNTDGSVAWITNAGSDQFDNAFDVVTDDFGNVYLGGHFFGTNISFSNGVFNNSSVDGELFLARYDAGTGANIWGQAFGGIGEELLLNLATDGTNVFMTGTREPFPASFGSVSVENGRYYLINVDPDGNVSWVDVAEGHMRGRGMTYYNGTLYIPGRFEYRINVGGTYYDSNSNTSDAFLGKVTVGVAGNEIAFFPFTGGSTADVLGNGFVGTVVNATTTTDRFNDIGNAYNFDPNDGSRDAIVGNSTLGLSQTLTFAAWIKPSAFGNGQQYTIISERMNGAESWQFAIIDDFLYFSKWDPSFIESTSNSNSGLLSVNRWQHVAVTYDGSDARFYVNGQLDVTSGMSGDIRTNATVYQIGRWGTDDEYFDGDIDDIHVYDYALSDSDIQSLYNSESGLTEWFPLDNGDANEFYGKLVATPNGNPVSTSDRFGSMDEAMNFDGSGSFGYNGNTSIGGSSRFSISAWARPNYDGPIGTILSENSVAGQQNFYVDLGGNAVAFITYDNAQTLYSTNSGSTIKPFEWNHVVVTFDNGEITTYVNNQLSSTGSHTSPVNDGTSPLAIGAATLFNGDIDDIRIFNYSLSPEQVSDLFFENGWTGVSTAGLLATYPFNGNANDESGNGFNGAPTGNSNGGPGLTSDRFGNPNSTYLFDGFDDHIRIDHGGGINLGGEVTFNAWIKPTVYPSGGDLWSIIFKDDVINEFQLDAEGNINYHWFDGIGFPSMETQPYKAPLGVWSMATVTIDVSDNLSIYIDGELYASQLITRFISSPFTSSIGGDYNQLPADGGDRRWFTGAIDDVRIYNRALSQTDIKALYNFGGWTGPSDLIAHYPVNGTIGGGDISGNDQVLGQESGFGPSFATDRFRASDEAFIYTGIESLVARNTNHPQGEVTVSYSLWEYHTSDVSAGNLIHVGVFQDPNNRSAIALTGSSIEYLGQGNDVVFTTSIQPNRWNHIVVTKKGTEVNLYLNGQWVEQGLTAVGQNLTNTDIWVGSNDQRTE